MNLKKTIKFKIAKLLYQFDVRYHSLMTYYQRCRFSSCGDNVGIGLHCDFVESHIDCGDNVVIGSHSSFMAGISMIHIGNNVVFGPHVTIRGGNHRIDLIGKHIIDVTVDEKLPSDDADVVIEDGVWVGCNVTILKGVTLGEGCVIGAGAVVTKSIPAYAIAVGNPAKVIKYRFSEEDIIRHRKLLNTK